MCVPNYPCLSAWLMIPGWLHCACLIVQCQTRLLRAPRVPSAPCKVFTAYSAFSWHRGSLQDCISLSQGSTTTRVAAPDSLPRLRVPEQAPDRDTKTPRGAAHQLSLQGKHVGPDSKSQEGSSPCFRKSQGVTRQVPSSIFSGKCISQILPNPSQH